MLFTKDDFGRYFSAIVGILVLFVVVLWSVWASNAHPDWEPPAEWLLEWTSWVGSAVGIFVVAKAIWAGGEAAKEFAIMKRNIRISKTK